MLAVAAAGAVPWLVHAYEMTDLNRQELPGVNNTAGVDHYSLQAAFAIAVPGARGPGRAVVAWTFPDAEGGMATGWAVSATAWGLILTAFAWLPRPKLARPRGRA